MAKDARKVGRGWRTPAKHESLNSMLGQEVGVIKSTPTILRAVWYDLSAGDGADWPNHCSPGLFVKHSLNLTVPCHIRLHECKRAHYDQLIGVLAEELPKLGFMRLSTGHWVGRTRHGHDIVLIAKFGGGQNALNSFVTDTDAVVVLMDPNAITHWAQSATFAEEINAATKWYRSLSVLGCNPSGIQGVIRPERRFLEWFGWIDDQVRALPQYPKQDLLLVRLDRDPAKWGYVYRTATKWRERTERSVAAAFKRVGADVEMAWYRLNPEHFLTIQKKLFLMAKELEE